MKKWWIQLDNVMFDTKKCCKRALLDLTNMVIQSDEHRDVTNTNGEWEWDKKME